MRIAASVEVEGAEHKGEEREKKRNVNVRHLCRGGDA